MAYTAPTTRATGLFVTAAIWNTDLVDNIIFLANPPTAQVKFSVDQSIANNTLTTLTWNEENWDTDVIHDNVTNNSRLTAKTAGKYKVHVHLEWALNATGYRAIELFKNAAILHTFDTRADGQATFFSGASPYIELALVVNDFLEIKVQQNSGGALVLKAARTVFGMTMFSQ